MYKFLIIFCAGLKSECLKSCLLQYINIPLGDVNQVIKGRPERTNLPNPKQTEVVHVLRKKHKHSILKRTLYLNRGRLLCKKSAEDIKTLSP